MTYTLEKKVETLEAYSRVIALRLSSLEQLQAEINSAIPTCKYPADPSREEIAKLETLYERLCSTVI